MISLMFGFRKTFFDPRDVKEQGLSKTQFRIEIASVLYIRYPLFFYTWGTTKHIFSVFRIKKMSIKFETYSYTYTDFCTESHGDTQNSNL